MQIELDTRELDRLIAFGSLADTLRYAATMASLESVANDLPGESPASGNAESVAAAPRARKAAS